MQDHRKIRAWRLAHQIAIDVRRLTERFPRRGYAEFKEQMTSAAESIAHNIVEGCGAATQKEFARFLDMAIKSTRELEEQLELGRDYGIIAEREWQQHGTDVVDVRKMLCSLRNRVLEADANERTNGKRQPSNGKRKTANGKRPTGSSASTNESPPAETPADGLTPPPSNLTEKQYPPAPASPSDLPTSKAD